MPNFEFANFFNAFDGANGLTAAREWVILAFEWLQMKYAEAPALVLGLAFALALPVIATTGALVRHMLNHSHQPHSAILPTVRTRPISSWRQSAYLEVSDDENYPINQGIVRIGRESDNDLRLSHPTVHRYHAVLERTPDAEFMISYIGDPDLEGLRINGQAAHRQRLRGGEELEIGAIKLRFALSPV